MVRGHLNPLEGPGGPRCPRGYVKNSPLPLQTGQLEQRYVCLPQHVVTVIMCEPIDEHFCISGQANLFATNFVVVLITE